LVQDSRKGLLRGGAEAGGDSGLDTGVLRAALWTLTFHA